MEKVEVTENLIRVPNPDFDKRGCDTLRTIEVSPKDGIQALFCVDNKQIKTFLFDRDKWTKTEAVEWVKQRTKGKGMSKTEYIKAGLQEVDGEKLFVASTDNEDRDGEKISVTGWQLKNFKSNPVLLWAHDHGIPAIGTAESIGIKTINGKKALAFKPKFHDITQLARDVGKMVKEGIINTVSVGFLPIERDGNEFTKQELLEISFVNVPSNPEARQLALSKGISEDSVKEVFGGEEKEKKEEKEEECECQTCDCDKSVKDRLDDIEKLLRQKEDKQTANKVGQKATDTHNIKRNAQIVQKAVELILKQLKD